MQAGSYTVVVTQNGCPPTSSATVVTVNTAPTASATIAPANCSQSTGAVNLTVTGATGTPTYSWSNGATTQNLSNVPAGNYGVTVTSGNGCTATASATVQNTDGPSASASATNPLCFGQNGSVSLAASGGTGALTFKWSTGATTQNLPSVPAGNYTCTVTDANNCTAVASVTVNQPAQLVCSAAQQSPATSNISADGSATATVSGGTAPFTLNWSGPTPGQLPPQGVGGTLSNLKSGNYTLTVTDANGCTSSTAFSISNSQPCAIAVSVAPKNTVCGLPNGSATATVGGANGSFSVVWSSGGVGDAVADLPPGSFSVTATDATGCADTAFFNIGASANPVSVVLDAPAGVCAGEQTTLTAVPSGCADCHFAWSDAPGLDWPTHQVGPTAAATFSVTATDAQGCTASATHPLEVWAKPTAVLSGDTVVCPGTPTRLRLDLTGKSPWRAALSDGQETIALPVIESSPFWFVTKNMGADGVFQLEEVADARCADGAPAGSALVEVPLFSLANDYKKINEDQTEYTFEPLENDDVPASLFDLEFDRLSDPKHGILLREGYKFLYRPDNTQYTLQDSFQYFVRLSPCGVADTAWVFLADTIPCPVVTFSPDSIPNVITPNGDGLNDCFEPMRAFDPAVYTGDLTIYSRWGEVVFHSSRGDGWMGKNPNGNPVPQATYYWVLKLTRLDGAVIPPKTGSLAVLNE
ncbi:MAG: gliding motility-associated C-terminal domain-containing protein [Saprospiraceae bacterium]